MATKSPKRDSLPVLFPPRLGWTCVVAVVEGGKPILGNYSLRTPDDGLCCGCCLNLGEDGSKWQQLGNHPSPDSRFRLCVLQSGVVGRSVLIYVSGIYTSFFFWWFVRQSISVHIYSGILHVVCVFTDELDKLGHESFTMLRLSHHFRFSESGMLNCRLL